MDSLTRYTRWGAAMLAFVLTLFAGACSDDDPPLPDNLASFESASVGLDDASDEVEISVSLTRAVTVATQVVVRYSTLGVTYGEHFTTVPAAPDGELTLTVPAGSNTASFAVVRNPDVFLEGTESIVFTLDGVDEPALIGATAEVELSFAPIVSEGSELTLNGLIASETGSAAGNAVFVDFSNNQQTAVARTSWDLGFYNGDDFRVILNATSGSSVVAVDKTDIATVTSADVDIDALAVGFGEGNFDIVDNPSGDLSDTAIPAIAAAATENKVYVLNRVGGSGAAGAADDLVKIRVVRNANGYTLQHAKINETTFATLNISKDEMHTFSYVSFTTGALVEVEPVKTKWDIQWTWSLYQTVSDGVTLPYAFSDLVFLNHHNGVQAAEVLTTASTYDAFSESNLAAVTFSDSRTTIGSNWRVTSPTASAGVKTDRFYVIRDAAGNVYKLKFVSFHSNDGGTRGKPVIQYALVKKGE